MIFEIEAIDTVFFKDGKPFSMGLETWADGIFPPPPSVLYGALRALYFSEHIDQLSLAQTNNDPTKNLVIKNFSFKTLNYEYPIPKDLISYKDSNKSEKGKLFLLEKRENSSVNYKQKFQYFLKSPKEAESIEDGIFNKGNLEDYLTLKEDSFTYSKMSKYITYEPKIGIARTDISRTSEDGNLYRVNMVRIDSLKFIAEIEGLSFPSESVIHLGAESKAASIKQLPDAESISPNFPEITNQFKLYLATPTFFKNGSLPSWVDPQTLIGEYKGLKLQLDTMSVGKYISIGGFDIKNKKAKTMRRAVPGGSVYYFTILDGNKDLVKECFHNKSISEERASEGFGICYVGRVK